MTALALRHEWARRVVKSVFMQRRAFLQQAAATLAATAGAQAAGKPEWRNRQAGMEYRRLGRTDFQISAITFGTQQVRPGQTQPVEVAVDMGLNYLDTAAAYGKGLSEEGLAPAIAGAKRDRVFLTTKIQPWLHGRNALFQKIYETLPEAEQKRLKGEAAEYIKSRRGVESDHIGGYYAGQRNVYEASILSNFMEKKYGDRIDRRAHHHDLILSAFEESLKRLKTDHVDILVCPHGA